jgi:hypothetical protein
VYGITTERINNWNSDNDFCWVDITLNGKRRFYRLRKGVTFTSTRFERGFVGWRMDFNWSPA